MKKIVLILFIISAFLIFKDKESVYVLPADAIRFRIIANSNTLYDQKEKVQLKTKLEEQLSKLLKNSNSSSSSRMIITNNLGKIEDIIKEETKDYSINYGYNYFPKKTYRNVIYPEGEYESLVVTLGNGLGNNWWCVLYPPLCFIDEEQEIESYDFYVKKIFDQIKS